MDWCKCEPLANCLLSPPPAGTESRSGYHIHLWWPFSSTKERRSQKIIIKNLYAILLNLSLKEKIHFILSATAQHAKNLAFFALLYKSVSLLLNKLMGKTHPLHNFIGGLTGGYFVFGSNNKVNMQVCVVIGTINFVNEIFVKITKLLVPQKLEPSLFLPSLSPPLSLV